MNNSNDKLVSSIICLIGAYQDVQTISYFDQNKFAEKTYVLGLFIIHILLAY